MESIVDLNPHQKRNYKFIEKYQISSQSNHHLEIIPLYSQSQEQNMIQTILIFIPLILIILLILFLTSNKRKPIIHHEQQVIVEQQGNEQESLFKPSRTGKKKQLKHQIKEQRRQNHMQTLHQRNINRQNQIEQEMEEEMEAYQREERERKAAREKERADKLEQERLHKEWDEWGKGMGVEEQGVLRLTDEQQKERLMEVMNRIKQQKSVYLESIAHEFQFRN